MRLSPDDVARYRQDGILVVPGMFDDGEVDALRAAFERDITVRGPYTVAESDGDHVRAVYASHQRQAEYARLVRSPRILDVAGALIGPDVYVYQCKINAKPAFGGDSWSWHQDFTAWRLADNLPAPALLNVAVFLDDVNEFNGPIVFVPGSHLEGPVSDERRDEHRSEQHVDPDDIALSPPQVAGLVDRHGMVSPKGSAGSAVFFHPEVVHGSAANMSPFQRRVLIVTYNSVTNLPRPVGEPRPDYLVCRDTTPIVADGGRIDEPVGAGA